MVNSLQGLGTDYDKFSKISVGAIRMSRKSCGRSGHNSFSKSSAASRNSKKSLPTKNTQINNPSLIPSIMASNLQVSKKQVRKGLSSIESDEVLNGYSMIKSCVENNFFAKENIGHGLFKISDTVSDSIASRISIKESHENFQNNNMADNTKKNRSPKFVRKRNKVIKIGKHICKESRDKVDAEYSTDDEEEQQPNTFCVTDEILQFSSYDDISTDKENFPIIQTDTSTCTKVEFPVIKRTVSSAAYGKLLKGGSSKNLDLKRDRSEFLDHNSSNFFSQSKSLRNCSVNSVYLNEGSLTVEPKKIKNGATNSKVSEDKSKLNEDPSNVSEDTSKLNEDPSNVSEDKSKLNGGSSNVSEDKSKLNGGSSNVSEDGAIDSRVNGDPSNGAIESRVWGNAYKCNGILSEFASARLGECKDLKAISCESYNEVSKEMSGEAETTETPGILLGEDETSGEMYYDALVSAEMYCLESGNTKEYNPSCEMNSCSLNESQIDNDRSENVEQNIQQKEKKGEIFKDTVSIVKTENPSSVILEREAQTTSKHYGTRNNNKHYSLDTIIFVDTYQKKALTDDNKNNVSNKNSSTTMNKNKTNSKKGVSKSMCKKSTPKCNRIRNNSGNVKLKRKSEKGKKINKQNSKLIVETKKIQQQENGENKQYSSNGQTINTNNTNQENELTYTTNMVHVPQSSSQSNDSVTKDEGGVIKCLCGHDDDNGVMVQCEHCFTWQHVKCVGFASESSIPDNYICELCISPNFLRNQGANYIDFITWFKEGRFNNENVNNCCDLNNTKKTEIIKKTNDLVLKIGNLKNNFNCLDEKLLEDRVTEIEIVLNDIKKDSNDVFR